MIGERMVHIETQTSSVFLRRKLFKSSKLEASLRLGKDLPEEMGGTKASLLAQNLLGVINKEQMEINHCYRPLMIFIMIY